MRRLHWLAPLLALLLPAAARADRDDSPEVRKLLTERRDTLRNVVKGREEQYKAGRYPLEGLIQTYRELQFAELAATSTPAGRADALVPLYRTVAEQDDRLVQQYNMGFVNMVDCLLMRAERLALEIELRRAGGKPPADVKPPREIRPRSTGKPKEG